MDGESGTDTVQTGVIKSFSATCAEARWFASKLLDHPAWRDT
jgi:hypothetical protein